MGKPPFTKMDFALEAYPTPTHGRRVLGHSTASSLISWAWQARERTNAPCPK